MKRLLTLLAFLLPTASFALGLPQAPDIRVLDATVEAVPQNATTRVSARLVNPTSDTVTIKALGSPMAHSSRLVLFGKDSDGLTTMSEQTTLLLPPGETLIIPNVLEWRLETLTSDLTTGTELPLTLTFEGGTTRTYKAQVK